MVRVDSIRLVALGRIQESPVFNLVFDPGTLVSMFADHVNVRASEIALVDNRFVVDVTALATAVEGGLFDGIWRRVYLTREEFDKSTEKVRRRPSPLADDFMPLQLVMPGLGIVLETGDFVVIDGRQRADRRFVNADAGMAITVLPWAAIKRYTKPLSSMPDRERKLLTGELRASDESDGGQDVDIVIFAVPAKIEGRPPKEGLAGFLDALVVVRAAQLVRIDRKAVRKGDDDIKYRTHGKESVYLGKIVATINEIKMRAIIPAFATVKDAEKQSKEAIRKFYESYIGAEFAENVFDIKGKSVEDLKYDLVVFSQVQRAHSETSTGLRLHERVISGRSGVRQARERSSLWMKSGPEGANANSDRAAPDLVLANEFARRTGVYSLDIFPHLSAFADLIRWHQRYFYISVGKWLPIESVSEATQFLHWSALIQNADDNQEIGKSDDPMLSAWFVMFLGYLEHRPVASVETGQTYPNALHFSISECMRFMALLKQKAASARANR